MPTFSMLTFNCLGAPGVGTRRRLLTLARELEGALYDVVCLQEVQAQMYRRLLMRACTSYACVSAPYIYAPRGGLLTLARPTIIGNQFTPFRERGRLHSPAIIDWPLHKGVLRTTLALGDLPIVVFNTHLNANYIGNWSPNNHFAHTEHAQLRQLAELVNAQPTSALVVVAGDFNIPRRSWLYEEFLALSGLSDPLADDPRPTYRPTFGIPKRYALAFDYVLVRAPPLLDFQVREDLRFRDRLPLLGGRLDFLSDHYAVELQLSWAASGPEVGATDQLRETPRDQGEPVRHRHGVGGD